MEMKYYFNVSFTDDIIKLNKKKSRGGSRGGRGGNRGGRGGNRGSRGGNTAGRNQGLRGRGQGQGGQGQRGRGGSGRGNRGRMGRGSGRGAVANTRGGGNSVADRVKGKGPNKYKQFRMNLMKKKPARGGMGVSPLNRINTDVGSINVFKVPCEQILQWI